MHYKFFSERGPIRIGSFLHGHAIVEAKLSDEALALADDPELVESYADDPNRLLELLLEWTSLHHERVHYLDSYGSLAGATFFAAHTDAMERFIEVGGELTHRKSTWTLPLSKWVLEPDCPDNVRALYRHGRAYQFGIDRFLTPFKPFGSWGTVESPWINIGFRFAPDQEVVPALAYPLSFGLRTASDGDPPKLATSFQPLGFCAVAEGRAHSIARSMIEAQFPTIPPHFMVQYGVHAITAESVPNAQDVDAMAAKMSPYNTTDLLVTRFLREKGIHQFPRSLILKLSDVALSKSYLKVWSVDHEQTAVKAVNPGNELVDILTSTSEADLLAVAFDHPASVDAVYRAQAEMLSRGGDWDTVEPLDSPYVAHKIWVSFVAQHIVLPLLERRLDTRHECFCNIEQLLELAKLDGLPRIEVVNGRARFHGIPAPVQTAWARQMFMVEIAHQILSDATVILCPRAHALLPGMESLDFAEGRCRSFMEQGCGSSSNGQCLVKPSCMFTEALQLYGLLPMPTVSADSEP